MSLFNFTLKAQTIYYTITAVWPLVHMESFMAVSGPKTDVWLVRTVAILLLAISFCFITQLIVKGNEWPVVILAVSCCVGLIFIDCYYSLNGTISKIYLADAVAEFLLLLLWGIVIMRLRRR